MTTALVPILLDHRGNPMPRTEVSRARRQMMRARYDAAQTTRENTRHWANADFLGPESALDPATRRTIRARARYEVANNSYASGMVRTVAADTIGTGAGLQITTGSPSAARKAEEAFWSWCLAVNLPPKMRTMKQGKTTDGETFASFFTNRRLRNPVSLDLQPHEPEMIANPTAGFTDFSNSDGILFDDFGNVIAYQLLPEHPGESQIGTIGTDSELVRADDMIHLFNCERAGQVRGCSEITPALPLYAQLRRYTLAVISCAEAAANHSWMIKTQQMPSEMEIGQEWETFETERGMGTILPAGYEMQQLRAEQPTSTYGEFKRCIIAEIARCLSMPYNVAAGDSSTYNYSSGRLDHKTYYKAIRVERSLWEAKFLDVVLAKWWEEARLIPDLLPAEFADLQTPPAHSWRWDGDEHVDPVKEGKATETRLKIGVTSWDDECARLGGDVAVIHQKNADALGLTLDEYRARLADSLFGTKPTVPDAIDPDLQDEPPASSSQGGRNG